MREIPLTQGKVALVDDEDYDLVSGYSWVAYLHKEIVYAKAWNKKAGGNNLLMHQLIMGETPVGYEIDHKNGNGIDNRSINLRFCTKAQNMQNARKYKRQGGTSSKYKGVSLKKDTGKWVAYIRVNTKLKHLGSFVNQEEAARAYDLAAEEYFGEFANKNF